MKTLQKGFTLIELMIVVAIVGILAAVAIPAYRDYTIRAKVSEVAATVGACKTSVTEYYNSRAAFPPDTAASGCSTSASQYMTTLTVAAGGVITGVVNAAGVGITAGGDCNLVMTPALDGDGQITAWAGTTSCDPKYVPATFRG